MHSFVHMYSLVEGVLYEDHELKKFFCLFIVVKFMSIFEWLIKPYS